jgi:hypothetical protein
MKRSLKITVFFVLLAAASTAAVYADGICLISDRYWRFMLEHEKKQESLYRLKKRVDELIPFRESGYISVEENRIRVLTAAAEDGDAGLSAVSDLIKESGEKVFILSPLISHMTCSLAELFPECIIIGLGDNPAGSCAAGNAGMIIYSYSEAFFEAGSWAARNGLNTNALFYTGSGYRSNMDAFVNGWNSVNTEAELTVNDFSDVDDTAFIDSYKGQFGSDDDVAAVFAGPHNQTVLELMDGTDRRIISQHLLLWRNTRYNVIGTVDITPVQLLAGALKYVNKGVYRPEEAIEASFTELP